MLAGTTRITYVTLVTIYRLETVLDSVLDSNSPQAIGDLFARRVSTADGTDGMLRPSL